MMMTWIGKRSHCLSLYRSSRSNGHCYFNPAFSLLSPPLLSSGSGGGGIGSNGGFCDVHSLLSPVILIILLLVASQSAVSTLVSLLIVFPSSLFIVNYTLPRLKFTNFFLSWSISSFIIILSIFEFEVVPYLEILLYENLIFLSLTSCSLISAIIIRKRSQSTTIALLDHPSSHYCSWLKCSINSSNKTLYMVGLVVTTCVLIYGSQLMTTTICHPYLAYGSVLLPDDCSDVYSDF